jgi:hypothetical protein
VSDTIFTDCSPIFVVGVERSGTTLLQLMLNAHPNISIIGEVNYFGGVLQIKKMIPSIETPENLERVMGHVKYVNTIRRIPCIEQILQLVKQRLGEDTSPTYEKFYKYLLEEYARRRGAGRFGEKTATNVRYLEKLLEIFPNCRILHIVRDPRAVVASMIKTSTGSSCVVTNAIKWEIEILYSRNFSKKTNSYIELLYEDLVQRPEAQLKRICEFIEEEYDCKMLDFYKTAKFYLNNQPDSEGAFRPTFTGSIGKWRVELSEARLFIIEKIVASVMYKFGYQKSRIRFRSKLGAPLVFLLELLKYLKFKFTEIKLRRGRDRNIIFGKSTRLFDLFFQVHFRFSGR